MGGITRNEEVHSHAPVLFADHLHGAISEGGWCQESGNAPDSTDLSSGKVALLHQDEVRAIAEGSSPIPAIAAKLEEPPTLGDGGIMDVRVGTPHVMPVSRDVALIFPYQAEGRTIDLACNIKGW